MLLTAQHAERTTNSAAHVTCVCLVQERLWKRRAAYHIGHAAAAEGRRRLEAAAAKKEAAAKSSSGRGSKAAKKEEAEQQLKQQQSIAGRWGMRHVLVLQAGWLHGCSPWELLAGNLLRVLRVLANTCMQSQPGSLRRRQVTSDATCCTATSTQAGCHRACCVLQRCWRTWSNPSWALRCHTSSIGQTTGSSHRWVQGQHAQA